MFSSSRKILFVLVTMLSTLGVRADAPIDRPRATPEPGEELSGGGATVFDATSHAYELAARNLSTSRRRLFGTGNALFNDNWVEAPASTAGRDGLGPLFNARSCSGCHPKDGRGEPDISRMNEPRLALIFRLSVPDADGPKPHPIYGDQLQNHSIAGIPVEGQVDLETELIRETYADGTEYHLYKPVYTFRDLGYGALGDNVMISPRLAPAVFGLGLLAALPGSVILAHADPDDSDGNGISGRPNLISVEGKESKLGRFGWKANVATLREQITGAFHADIGITSSHFPRQEATESQTAALASVGGGEPELDEHKLERIEFYMHTLAVPARRDCDDWAVLRGKLLFRELKCGECHLPVMTTGEMKDFPELSGQTIHPYTDLLLHDMGEALADGRPDHAATGSEWRTPPLWGLGLLRTVNGHTRLLHDGRALVPAEAILWHGGEAESSREAFKRLDASDRAALLRFLDSL